MSSSKLTDSAIKFTSVPFIRKTSEAHSFSRSSKKAIEVEQVNDGKLTSHYKVNKLLCGFRCQSKSTPIFKINIFLLTCLSFPVSITHLTFQIHSLFQFKCKKASLWIQMSIQIHALSIFMTNMFPLTNLSLQCLDNEFLSSTNSVNQAICK